MFRRLRKTYGVLRPARPDSETRVRTELHNHAAVDRGRSAVVESLPSARNPAVVILETAVVVYVMLELIGPFVQRIFDYNADSTWDKVVVAVGAIVIYQAVAFAEVHMRARVNLNFLDPYVGTRIRRTIEIFKRG